MRPRAMEQQREKVQAGIKGTPQDEIRHTLLKAKYHGKEFQEA